MIAIEELQRLLSLVRFCEKNDDLEGIEVFRDLLDDDSDGVVLEFLTGALPMLEGQRRGGIAFAIAEHFRKSGDVQGLCRLFTTGDACIRRDVLNALWGEPGANPEMGPTIVQIAIDAASDAAPEVRTEVSSVLQNQCAWGVDVSAGIATLRALLKDRDSRVRRQAGFAVGNFAKRRYEMSACIAPLRRNVGHKDMFVRESSAWALWELSRHKHDIGAAVPDLVKMLTETEDYNKPRMNAAGALLHHAKKSTDNASAVKTSVRAVALAGNQKKIKRFLDELARL